MDNNRHISNLFQKFLDGNINAQEYGELLDYFGQDTSRDELRVLILKAIEEDKEDNILRMHHGRIEEVRSNVRSRISDITSEVNPPKTRKIPRFIPYTAAAVILLLGLGAYLFLFNPDANPDVTAVVAENDIEPGTNRAILTLTDGTSYILNEDRDGITADQVGVRYNDGEDITGNMVSSIVTLTTPRGGQYRITLPDGTKVFVNSASSLQYPSKFDGNLREVTLEGEAYFEVAHNTEIPFVVKGANQSVKVLGTKFNLNNYIGEPAITTLLEGSVLIDVGKAAKSVILRPGDQATVQENKVSVNKVYSADYIGWTKDLFILDDAPLTAIMKQLERWYDIEVEYPASFKDEHFVAEIPRNRKLSEVLRALEKAGSYKFEQQGRRVMVRR